MLSLFARSVGLVVSQLVLASICSFSSAGAKANGVAICCSAACCAWLGYWMALGAAPLVVRCIVASGFLLIQMVILSRTISDDMDIAIACFVSGYTFSLAVWCGAAVRFGASPSTHVRVGIAVREISEAEGAILLTSGGLIMLTTQCAYLHAPAGLAFLFALPCILLVSLSELCWLPKIVSHFVRWPTR